MKHAGNLIYVFCEEGDYTHDVPPNSVDWTRLLFMSLPYQVRRAVWLSSAKRKRIVTRALSGKNADLNLKPYIDNNCIFIHVPKAAGNSIRSSIEGGPNGGHHSYLEFEHMLGRNMINQLGFFSVVRNPWSRLFSAYNYLRQGGMGDGDAKFATRIRRHDSFQDFVYTFPKNLSYTRMLHFIPQHRFICNSSGDLMVEKLGKYETLEDDIQDIFDHFQIPYQGLPYKNKTRGLEREDYRSAYDSEMIEIVRSIYSKDCELFGYDFE